MASFFIWDVSYLQDFCTDKCVLWFLYNSRASCKIWGPVLFPACVKLSFVAVISDTSECVLCFFNKCIIRFAVNCVFDCLPICSKWRMAGFGK